MKKLEFVDNTLKTPLTIDFELSQKEELQVTITGFESESFVMSKDQVRILRDFIGTGQREKVIG